MNSVPVMNVGVATHEKSIMKRPVARSERGQSIVIFTLLLFALMGMLALTLDGGNGLLQRRLAQNAADAGALAGARELCITGDPVQAMDRAVEYAIDRNGALEAEVTVDTGTVTVNTMISAPTTFGNVLGQPELTAHATASAGCFAPGSGESVLPVAWSCRLGETILPDGSCNVEYDNDGYSKTYIIMDTSPVTNDHCAPQGSLDCDFDNDGENDMMLGGDRSWVDLNGDTNLECGGACELRDWIENGFDLEIDFHTWAPLQDGAETSTFQSAKTREGDIVLLPVFDAACQGDPRDEGCDYWHDGEDQLAGGDSCPAGQWCFHLITFSAFLIECVSSKPSERCDAKDQAIADDILDLSDKTIEGRFVRGFVSGLSGRPIDGVDAGAYTLYLTQ